MESIFQEDKKNIENYRNTMILDIVERNKSCKINSEWCVILSRHRKNIYSNHQVIVSEGWITFFVYEDIQCRNKHKKLKEVWSHYSHWELSSSCQKAISIISTTVQKNVVNIVISETRDKNTTKNTRERNKRRHIWKINISLWKIQKQTEIS